MFSTRNGNFFDLVGLNFVPVQTGPTNLMDVPIGQTDCAGQLDAFHKAEYIRPNFNRQKNDTNAE
jgi:hypothetical protein